MNTIIFCLAFLGISETGYLILKRLTRQQPICSKKLSCSLVLEGPYQKTFGIHNDLLGLLFYCMVVFLSVSNPLLPRAQLLLDDALKLTLIVGMLFSGYFIYLQWQRIKAWCLWCLASAATVFSMAAFIFNQSFISHL